VHKDLKVRQGFKALVVASCLMVLADIKEFKVLLAHKDQQALKDHKAHKVWQEFKAHKAQ
jgi:hypothetical protein